MSQKILKRTGLLLIAIGIIDIAYMIYVVSNGNSYHSSFNIFAIIAGAFLIKQNLKAARVIATFCSIYIAYSLGSAILTTVLFPFGFWASYIKNYFSDAATSFIFFALAVTVLSYIYTSLTNKEIVEDMEQSGQRFDKKWKIPSAGFAYGAIGSLIAIIMIFTMLRGDSANEAIARAQNQNGNNYGYFVSSIDISISNGTKSVSSIVTGYNDKEIVNFQINWVQ